MRGRVKGAWREPKFSDWPVAQCCSFCARPSAAVDVLVQAGMLAVCDVCVDRCERIVLETRRKNRRFGDR